MFFIFLSLYIISYFSVTENRKQRKKRDEDYSSSSLFFVEYLHFSFMMALHRTVGTGSAARGAGGFALFFVLCH